MRVRTVLLVLVLALIGLFVGVNWPAFAAPARLSLLVAQVELPVGLLALGCALLVLLTCGIYLALWRSSVLLESRQQARELQAQRALADQAEASRVVQLRETIVHEMQQLGDRIAQLQTDLRAEIRDNSNAVAATIAELDDRLQRLLPARTP